MYIWNVILGRGVGVGGRGFGVDLDEHASVQKILTNYNHLTIVNLLHHPVIYYNNHHFVMQNKCGLL